MHILRALIYPTMIAATISFAACSQHHKSDVNTIKVDMAKVEDVHISTDNIIPLAANDSSMLYNIGDIVPVGDTLYIASGPLLKAFSATDGRYIGNLGKMGEGPEEYRSVMRLWKKDGLLHIFDLEKKLRLDFSYDGKYVGAVNVKNAISDSDVVSTPNYIIETPDNKAYIAINSFIGGGDTSGQPSYSVYDKNLNFIKNIPGRYLECSGYMFDRGYTDTINHRLLMWEVLRDTIFSVSESDVIPLYALDFGKQAFPSSSSSKADVFQRVNDFNTPPAGNKYVSFIKYIQPDENNYIYFVCNDSDYKYYLIRFSEDDIKVDIRNIMVDNGRYSLQPFFKVDGNRILLTFKDNENDEANPAIAFFDISQIF